MVSRKMVHLVDYLTASAAHTDQGEIVIITIRPDQGSFRPHNTAILLPQAKRLLQDLQRLLAATSLLLLMLLSTGCSSRVEISTDRVTQAPEQLVSEKVDVVVAVDVLPPAVQEQPPQVTKLVEVTGNHNAIVNVAGDLHLHHHTHTHFHEAPERLEPTSKPARVEIQRRPIDPRCEWLRREYEMRTREWRRLSVFVMSTYDTDYILVREVDVDQAVEALEKAGHCVQYQEGGGRPAI